MILFISGGLVGLFVPIFLYKLFNFSLVYVILWYGIGNLLYGLTVAWGAQYLNKIGLRRSLRIAVIFGAVYYFILYFLNQQDLENWSFTLDKIGLLLIALILVLAMQRIFYWVPLHTDIAKFTSKRNRGKEISLFNVTSLIVGAIMPLVAGFLLLKYGYDILFIISIFIYFLALIPWIMLPQTKEKFSWGYIETWEKFFDKKRRKTIIAFIADGAEGLVGLVIWPIFIWELLDGNYLQVGALSSFIVVVTAFLQMTVGRFTDSSNKKKMIMFGSFFYAIGWIIKIFVITSFQIFIVSTYHNLAKIFTRTPFDTLTYERAADQGHYVDEYTVIHEMAINFGRVLMVILIVILLHFLSIQWVFVLAATASLGFNFLADDYIEEGRHSG